MSTTAIGVVLRFARDDAVIIRKDKKDRNLLFVNETSPCFSIVSRPPASAHRRNMLRRWADAGGRMIAKSEREWKRWSMD